MSLPTALTSDVGLGTAYERIQIYGLLERWLRGLEVRRALEGPVDGMAGIPGLHLLGLATRGVQVTVVLPSESQLRTVREAYRALGVEHRLETICADADWAGPSDDFDLVCAYNAPPLVEDWQQHLKALARRARYLFLALTNPSSYGVSFRRMGRRLSGANSGAELFDHVSTQPSVASAFLEQQVGRIVRHEYFDCPWWPDFFVPFGEVFWKAALRRVLPARVPERLRPAERGRFHYDARALPYFEGSVGRHELMSALSRHPGFDRRGAFLGRTFGHLHAYLVECDLAE